MITAVTQRQLMSAAHELIAGQKINAIKELRQVTGLGLKESKDTVDRISTTVGKSTVTVAEELGRYLYTMHNIRVVDAFTYDTDLGATISSIPATGDLTEVARLLQALLIEAKEQTALLKDFMEALE
jgi:hypothetical protein